MNRNTQRGLCFVVAGGGFGSVVISFIAHPTGLHRVGNIGEGDEEIVIGDEFERLIERVLKKLRYCNQTMEIIRGS